MTFYGKKTTYLGVTKRRQASKAKPSVSKGFASSPAGKHRALAMNAFSLAAKARAAGNTKHYWRMVTFGKKALSLSKSELKMWKLGKTLKTKAYAAHRAVSATAAYR